MIINEEESDPYLKAAILEVVENQMRNNDPPETNQTYDRLINEGHSEEDAKRLIGCVIALEMIGILKKKKKFDHARFVKALKKLPELPND
ncbi:MAG: hypothetical protein K9N52_07770 [Verrucomicrobia bacterium]|nr:hypothetical protein [Verrucomicrobiota bacterium]